MPIGFVHEKTYQNVVVHFENSKFGEVCNYNKEPFKTPLAGKEIDKYHQNK